MTYGNTVRYAMPKAKIAISLAAGTLERLDRLVENKTFLNRSQAIESALAEKLDRLDRVRLARECSKLDPAEERELAEESFSEELTRWPEY
jgi:Arc/MetJ-type ribon-helix-helix transcriptional regulator